MRRPKIRTIIATVSATALLAGGSAVAITMKKREPEARIGTAYAAQAGCVYRFIGNNVEQAKPDLPEHEMTKYLSVSYDLLDQSAEGSMYGFAKEKSYFVEGLGCIHAPHRPQFAQQIPPVDDRVNTVVKEGGIWHEPKPLEEESARAALDSALNQAMKTPGTRGMVVVRDGKLVGEKYAHGYHEFMPQLGWSMTKSLANVLLGRVSKEDPDFDVKSPALPGTPWFTGEKHATQDKATQGTTAQNSTTQSSTAQSTTQNTTAHNGAAQSSTAQSGTNSAAQTPSTGGDKAQITYDDLLRMQSGLQWKETYDTNGDVTEMLFRATDMAGYVAGKPQAHKAGTYRQYSTGSTLLACATMQQNSEVGRKLGVSAAWELVFRPLGMGSATLAADAQGNFACGSYAYAAPRDWAKLGQFMMDKGVVNGKQLLPKNWVRDSLREHPTEQVHRVEGEQRSPAYGSGWWLNEFADGSLHFPDLPRDLFWADGHDGQYMVIVPSEKLIVVRQGFSPGVSVQTSGTLDVVRAMLKNAPLERSSSTDSADTSLNY